jgi:Domain of unknown function (DUF6458)
MRVTKGSDHLRIGASVFLIAVGAIITFALEISVGWLDLDVVGWVLMVAGAIGLVATLIILGNRRRTVVSDSDIDRPL